MKLGLKPDLPTRKLRVSEPNIEPFAVVVFRSFRCAIVKLKINEFFLHQKDPPYAETN